MLKQGRRTSQSRTQAGSGGESELDVSPASRDIFPLSIRYTSQSDRYNGFVNEEVMGDLEEESMRMETHRAEDERRMRLDRESYRGSRIQSWSSDRNEQDHYDETDHSGRPFNRTFNPTRGPSPFQDDSYSSDTYYSYSDSSDEYPQVSDTFEGRPAVGREKADLDYDVDPRNPSPSHRTYRPSRAPSPYLGHTSYHRSYGDNIELARGARGNLMLRKDEKRKYLRNLRRLQRERDEEQKLEAAAKSLGQHFEKALKEDAEAKAAVLGNAQEEAERLGRAKSPERPRTHLHEMCSFSKLYHRDTISRDSTIGNEARMDDLLASVGKRMMKARFLKESRGESSNDGEGT